VSFDVEKHGRASWAGRGFEVEFVRLPADPTRARAQLTFVGPSGERTPFGDVARLRFAASYHGLPIERDADEIRVALGSWLVGPVRALVEVTIESYLIWGSWITTPPSSSRSVATLTRSSLSVPLALSLPVPLDRAPASSVALSLSLADGIDGARLFMPRSAPIALESGTPSGGTELDRAMPDWLAIASARGGVIARLTPRSKPLQRSTNALDVETSTARGAGFRIDLSGLAHGEYSADYLVQVVPPAPAGEALDSATAARAIEAIDRPLEHRVR
jgi:hypothetical protein